MIRLWASHLSSAVQHIPNYSDLYLMMCSFVTSRSCHTDAIRYFSASRFGFLELWDLHGSRFPNGWCRILGACPPFALKTNFETNFEK
jgi:hypothetical protein